MIPKGECRRTRNGNFDGNGNTNLQRILANIGKNGNYDGYCKGNCLHTILGNTDGNANVDGVNGNE